jgi:DNA-binding winged helix-turn-helix (wHTH) protein/tetratricopeptide (TPR) repeat protein
MDLDVNSHGQNFYEFGPFRLDPAQRTLLRDCEVIALQPKAFDILLLLVRNTGQAISKEALLNAIWPKVVVEESNLTQHIFLLRKALGDGEGGHRYIATLPRRGYQFAVPVHVRQHGSTGIVVPPPMPTADGIGETTNAERRPSSILGWRFLLGTIAASIAVALIALVALGYFNHPRTVSESDTIVLADFANSTGDGVFDTALRQALAAQLEQSPYLSFLSDQRIAQTLALMGKPKDAPVSAELAAEVCQRTGSAATIDGIIAKLGTQYLITLSAFSCSTGDTLGHAQARAGDKEHVLDALGSVAASMRTKLGESLSSVQRYDAPPEAVTTPSLEALQAYGLGYRTMIRGNNYPAAIPLFERAIAVDPDFAMAYARLGINFFNLGEPGRAAVNLQKAYNLRDRASERERLYITASYYAMSMRNFEAARQSYELWAQIYPRDPFAIGNLGVVYSHLGDYDKSLAADQKAWKLSPQNALVYSNIVEALLRLNRLEEAKLMASKAKELNLESPLLHANLYAIDFLRHDQPGMDKEAAELTDKPAWDDVILYAESDTAAYNGEFAQARQLTQRAVDAALGADKKETAAVYAAEGAVREALVGDKILAIHQATDALAIWNGEAVQAMAATALGLAGDESQAKRLADDLARDFPEDTILQRIAVPTIYAAVALSAGDPEHAIEVLRVAQQYELGQADQTVAFAMYPVYLRAEAYRAAKRSEAATEFQKIVDHPGVVGNEPIAALAQLGLARAYAASNDGGHAKAAYQEFLSLWTNADADLQIFKSAKLEYGKLP